MFLIPKVMPLAIKVYSPSPHFLLHIVNNDTVEELDMLFNIYQPNKVADVHISVVLLRFHPHLQYHSQMFVVPSLFRGVTPLLLWQSRPKRHLMAPSGECASSVKRISSPSGPTSLL